MKTKFTAIKAKVFRHGRGQAIQLPKEFRDETSEVYLKRTPEGFLVIARDPWEVFLEGVRELSDDFMAEGRQQSVIQARRGRGLASHRLEGG